MLYKTTRNIPLPVDVAMREPEHIDRWDLEHRAHEADQNASETTREAQEDIPAPLAS